MRLFTAGTVATACTPDLDSAMHGLVRNGVALHVFSCCVLAGAQELERRLAAQAAEEERQRRKEEKKKIAQVGCVYEGVLLPLPDSVLGAVSKTSACMSSSTLSGNVGRKGGGNSAQLARGTRPACRGCWWS